MQGALTMTKEQMLTGLEAGRVLFQEEWAHADEQHWVDELVDLELALVSAWFYPDGTRVARRIVCSVKHPDPRCTR